MAARLRWHGRQGTSDSWADLTSNESCHNLRIKENSSGSSAKQNKSCLFCGFIWYKLWPLLSMNCCPSIWPMNTSSIVKHLWICVALPSWSNTFLRRTTYWNGMFHNGMSGKQEIPGTKWATATSCSWPCWQWDFLSPGCLFLASTCWSV